MVMIMIRDRYDREFVREYNRGDAFILETVNEQRIEFKYLPIWKTRMNKKSSGKKRKIVLVIMPLRKFFFSYLAVK